MIVVKVGGSLYSHPRLGPGLRAYLAGLADEVVLIAGGGKFADAVRELDAVHSLGEGRAHWLAVRSLQPAAAFLAELVGDVPGVRILDAFAFLTADDASPDRLPHSWDITTDSIAARAAFRLGAAGLILLKSADVPADWDAAAEAGFVDAAFPGLVRGYGLRPTAVNFRAVLGE